MRELPLTAEIRFRGVESNKAVVNSTEADILLFNRVVLKTDVNQRPYIQIHFFAIPGIPHPEDAGFLEHVCLTKFPQYRSLAN